MSESVYYMDRRSDILVTDKQVVVGQHHYYLAQIEDVRLDSRHAEAVRKTEFYARMATFGAVIAVCASRFLNGPRLEGAVFELSTVAVTSGLIVLLILGLMEKSQHAVVVRHYDGAREEVYQCADRRRARQIMNAVVDALTDYKEGRSANNRGAMHGNL